jgi:hypothetical protein
MYRMRHSSFPSRSKHWVSLVRTKFFQPLQGAYNRCVLVPQQSEACLILPNNLSYANRNVSGCMPLPCQGAGIFVMEKRGTGDDVPGASIGVTGSPCETEQRSQQQTLFRSRRSSPSISRPAGAALGQLMAHSLWNDDPTIQRGQDRSTFAWYKYWAGDVSAMTSGT